MKKMCHHCTLSQLHAEGLFPFRNITCLPMHRIPTASEWKCKCQKKEEVSELPVHHNSRDSSVESTLERLTQPPGYQRGASGRWIQKDPEGCPLAFSGTVLFQKNKNDRRDSHKIPFQSHRIRFLCDKDLLSAHVRKVDSF